jgi:hypothetical protein
VDAPQVRARTKDKLGIGIVDPHVQVPAIDNDGRE